MLSPKKWKVINKLWHISTAMAGIKIYITERRLLNGKFYASFFFHITKD